MSRSSLSGISTRPKPRISSYPPIKSMTEPTAQQQALQVRLLRARKAVEDVASEALKSAQIDATVIGGGDFPSTSPRTINRHFGSDQTNNNNTDGNDEDDEYAAYEKERASSTAAFQLGMTLFGDDVSVIERTVQDKLSEVESEILMLTTDLRSSASNASTSTSNNNTSEASKNKDESGDGVDDAAMATMDEATMERLAQALAAKAAFLKKCSIARSLLDQEEKMALALLSHGDGFSAGTSGAGGSSSSSSSSLVESAKLLSEAENFVQEAEAGFDMAEKAIGMGGISNSGSVPPASAAAASDLEAAAKIAASLRAQVRRRRSDLKHRAAAAVDKSVGITREGLTVGASSSTSANSSASAAAASPTSGRNAASATIRSKPHDSLADAYDALALLSSGQGLDDAIRLIYSNLYELVLEPLISDHVEAFAAGRIPPIMTLHKSESRSAGVGPNRGMTYKLDWTKKQAAAASATSIEDIDEIEAWSHVLDIMTSILKFVRTHILLERSDLCRMLGRHLFGSNPTPPTTAAAASGPDAVSALLKAPSVSSAEEASPLLDMMVRAMWDTCLPAMASLDVLAGLPEMAKALCDRTASFESDLVDMDLLLVADDKARLSSTAILSPLSNFASNYERRFGEKRRTNILSEGRDILLKGDYHNTTTVGVAIPNKPNPSVSPLEFDETDDGMSIFALHKCSVSQVASNLMALCRKTMDEAVDPRSCATSAAMVALPQQLYRTARELLDLYRAIIPAAHGSEIASVPRTASVLHNDCVFFAHNCLTLGLEYKEKFLASGDDDAPTTARLRQLCTFVDLVPPFRELAERTMGAMIDRQKAQLLEVVGSRISILRDALRANESVVEWTDAETALTAGTYHLRHLSQAWRSVLSRDIYCRAMGNLADTIFSLYLDQVLSAPDLSEAAGNFIGALFRNATRSLSELFADQDGTASVGALASASTRHLSSFPAGSNYWEKFDAVGRFMFMSLADITAELGDGTFKSVTGQELSKLIVAAFDDSPKRAEVLRLLSAAENKM